MYVCMCVYIPMYMRVQFELARTSIAFLKKGGRGLRGESGQWGAEVQLAELACSGSWIADGFLACGSVPGRAKPWGKG